MTDLSKELCLSCYIELDEQGRCPACWGDVIGICRKCDELLSIDSTCPNGCENPFEEESMEAVRSSAAILNFGPVRAVQITLHSWPSGPRSMYLGQSLAKAFGVSQSKLKLIEKGEPRVYQTTTTATKQSFRKRLREIYDGQLPKFDLLFLE